MPTNKNESIQAARTRILHEVQSAMVRRRRTRRAARVAVPGVMFLLVSFVVWHVYPPRPAPPILITPPPISPPIAATNQTPLSPTLPRVYTFINVLQSTHDPASSVSDSARVHNVSDAELLHLLATAGYDIGLVRIAGQTTAVCNSCSTENEWLSQINQTEER